MQAMCPPLTVRMSFRQKVVPRSKISMVVSCEPETIEGAGHMSYV